MGKYLKKHLVSNISKACSILTFTDSSFYKKYKVDNKYKSDVLWTGRRGFGDNNIRNEVIDYLLESQGFQVKIFGIENTQWIQDDYVNYINGAKIGIGVNSFNKRKYSSDRLGNYIACGTFYLPHYFEGIEEIFKQGINLDWFKTIDELDEKIKFYLKHDAIRRNIARASQKFILSHFDYKPLVSNVLYFIKTKKSKYIWDEIY